LSLRGPRIREAQGLDGVFIAARREWIARVGLDAERIRGFHFYDLDFTYRAYLAGARITIASDLALVHRSHGTFDAAWSAAQSAFGKKHVQLDSTAGTNRHWYTVALANEEAVTELYAKLFAVWRLELP
jgi:GT2 family glycosyltransferase